MSDQVLHDKDIREPLFDFLEETYGKVRKASFSYSRHCWNGWITTSFGNRPAMSFLKGTIILSKKPLRNIGKAKRNSKGGITNGVFNRYLFTV